MEPGRGNELCNPLLRPSFWAGGISHPRPSLHGPSSGVTVQLLPAAPGESRPMVYGLERFSAFFKGIVKRKEKARLWL